MMENVIYNEMRYRGMKLRRDDNGIVLMGVYEFLRDASMLDA